MNPSRSPGLSCAGACAGAWPDELAVNPPGVTTPSARTALPTLHWVRDLLAHESCWDVIDRERARNHAGSGPRRTSGPGMTRETALVEIEAACALSRYLCGVITDPALVDAERVFSEQRSALEASFRDAPCGVSRLEAWRTDAMCTAWRSLSTTARQWLEITGPVQNPRDPIEGRRQQFNAIVWGKSGRSRAPEYSSAARCLADLEAASQAGMRGHRFPAQTAARQRALDLQAQAAREATDRWVAARKASLTQVPAPSLPPVDVTVTMERMNPRSSRSVGTSSLPPARQTPERIYLPPLLAAPDALSACLQGRMPEGSMPRIAFELPRHGGQRYEDPRDFLGDLQVVHHYLRGPSVREHVCGRTLATLVGKVREAMAGGHPPPATALAGLLDTARRASVCIDARQALTTISIEIEERASRGAADFRRDARTFQSALRDLDTCMNDAGGTATVLARHGRYTAVEAQWRAIENRIEQLVHAGAAMLRPA